jgi:D-sedoheptulose 7-phosphate isomerase
MVQSNPFTHYAHRLVEALQNFDWAPVERLAVELQSVWEAGGHLFLCGNGGSAGNALHLANDFLYGIGKPEGIGLRVTALNANPSVLTCLANDLGYDKVFSAQLKVLARPGDMLIVLSGSGNSPNLVGALEMARSLGVRTAAVLGYDGGRCREMADTVVHFAVADMQIAEDLQLVVGHMLMQWLQQHRPSPSP